MLSLMALVGGVSGTALANPAFLLVLVIYFFMPLAGIAMIVIAKALTPGE